MATVITTLGVMDEEQLDVVRSRGQRGEDVVEYYYKGELVHRSVDAKLVGVIGQGHSKDLTRP
jgi:hypothetical protein